MQSKAKYEIRSYLNKKLSVWTATYAKAQALNWKSYDHFLSQTFGIWSFRQADGNQIIHYYNWPGLGNKSIMLIQATQENPGINLPPIEIYNLTGEENFLDNNNISARWMHLRKIHKETFQKPHFFLSQRVGGLCVAWHPQRSWLSIEQIPTINKN